MKPYQVGHRVERLVKSLVCIVEGVELKVKQYLSEGAAAAGVD